MKKWTILIIGILMAFAGSVSAEGMTFETYKKLITEDVMPEGFKLNESRSMDLRTSFRLEFTGDESKMEMISISRIPASISVESG